MRFYPLMLAMLWLPATAALRPVNLRCEYRQDPLGIDVTQPRLSWMLEATDPKARNQKQSAYQVVVGDLWDSGKVVSDKSIHIVYAGKPLDSGRQVWWKVRVWDQDGHPSAWSALATWSMGLLSPGDWKAQWIGLDRAEDKPAELRDARWIGGHYLRRSITLPQDKPVSNAVALFVTAGKATLWINGARAAATAGPTDPVAADVTKRLRPGRNVIGLAVDGGDPAGLAGSLRILLASGSPVLLYTGADWRAADSAPAGWEKPEFDDAAWTAARVLGNYGDAPWGDKGFSESRVLPARVLRKEFTVAGKLRRATAYVCGLGLFELYINGPKAGADVLAPALSDYDKRAYYVTYDVTRLLKTGRNAIGAMLGNGRYYAPRFKIPIGTRTFGYPKLLLQLALEYEDGKTETIVSDATWKFTTGGPIRANNEYDGEEYDARMELPGWGAAGFNDASWRPAEIVPPPAGRLAAQPGVPLHVTETLRPVAVTEPQPGTFIFDLGQNIVGWCRLRVSGPKGAAVTLRHAESLRADGTLYMDNLRSAKVTDIYILKGQGAESYEPRFTYHGFRYVEVTGYPGKPPRAAIEGRVVHDDLEQIASFHSSNALLDRIHKNILWGTRGNYRSIPTDCPQRDERHGWQGDRAEESLGEAFLFDIAPLYSKWMIDIEDTQRPDGSISDVAPNYWPLYNNSTTWPGTFTIIPDHLYEAYGDTRAIERHYPAMQKWMRMMSGFLKNDLMPKDTYGDWCVPPESPKLIHSQDPNRKTDATVIGTAYFHHLLRLMARYARILGKAGDARDYDALAEKLKAAFHRAYFNQAAARYSNGSQTSSILPLAFGMVPEASRHAVFQGLIGKIEEESKGHVGTGLVGGQWLMRVLSDNGRADVAYQIATQTSYPSWGYMIEKGATTIWELWNGDTADPAMNSLNHVMLVGDLNIWLYEYLAGIRPDPESPGFRHTIIRPVPAGDLTFVSASHKSMYGTIRSAWKRAGRRFTLDVEVPVNTTATVYVPGESQPREVGSGTWSFTSQVQ